MAGIMEELCTARAEKLYALADQQKAQKDQIVSLIEALHQKINIGIQIEVKTVQPTQTFAANHDFNNFGSTNMTQNQNSNQNDHDFNEFDSTKMSQIQNENQNLNISASNYSDELIHSHQIGDCIDLSKTIGSSISICSGPIDPHKSASNFSDELINLIRLVTAMI